MARIYSLLSLFLIGLVGNAQPYIPLLGDITEWHVVTCFNGCGVDRYNASGDILVDGQHYQVLDGYHYIQGNFLLREDVNERIVYLKLLGGHSLLDEYPLYDFSLGVGDTTHVYNPISPMPEDGGLFVVDSIVPRPLVHDDHRFFYLHAVDPIASQSESTIWVEGIGALSLINSPGAGPEDGEHTACCFYNGVTRYQRLDSLDECRAVFADVEDLKEPDRAFTIYPSIFTEEVTVSITDVKSDWNLEIVDVLGNLIYRKTRMEATERIQSKDLPNGILLITLIDESGIRHTERVVNLKD